MSALWQSADSFVSPLQFTGQTSVIQQRFPFSTHKRAWDVRASVHLKQGYCWNAQGRLARRKDGVSVCRYSAAAQQKPRGAGATLVPMNLAPSRRATPPTPPIAAEPGLPAEVCLNSTAVLVAIRNKGAALQAQEPSCFPHLHHGGYAPRLRPPRHSGEPTMTPKAQVAQVSKNNENLHYVSPSNGKQNTDL